MKPYVEIIRNYNLWWEWDKFVRSNPSNNLPYHNQFHAQCMIENCYEGAQYYNLPRDTTREILVAAMFHDFAHSGGKTPDSINVQKALAESQAHNFSKTVFDCIKCTEYPFVVEPYTIEQRIIRDADLMQFRFPNWEDMLLVQLKKEIEIAQCKEITEDEMIAGQREFWKGITFFTEWGDKVLEEEGYPFMSHIGIWSQK